MIMKAVYYFLYATNEL